jgi:ATP-dependent exoDNAse (exonuclease V) alpha subunit
MAIYHFSLSIIGRSKTGKAIAGAAYVSGSVVAGAAYRSGEKIVCKYNGQEHDYTAKTGVVHTEIILPPNAPKEFYDRSVLWNAVELKNNRKDAQLAREINIALPVEFTREEQVEIVREYINKNYTEKGICADFAVHDNGDGNPHAHVMFTMDNVSEKGFGLRLDEEKANKFYLQAKRLEDWRKDWAEACNELFEKKKLDIRIDHRTYEAQGIDKIPTIHLGKEAHALEKKGIRTERGNINRQIIQFNKTKGQLLQISTLTETNMQYKLEVRQCLRNIRAEMKAVEREVRLLIRCGITQAEANRQNEYTVKIIESAEVDRPGQLLERNPSHRERPSRDRPERDSLSREQPSRDRLNRDMEFSRER